MENKLNKFINDFTFGFIVHMDYCNKSTLYVDSELCDYLDIKEVEDNVLNEVMSKVVNEINKNDLFESWISSSNEITVERKEYLNLEELI